MDRGAVTVQNPAEAGVREILARARAHFMAGDLEAVAASLASVARIDPLPEREYLQGVSAYMVDDFGATQRHLETAFRQYRALGDLRAAIRVAAELADLHASVFGNRVLSRGWIARGQRLADRVGRCAEQGYLYVAILCCVVADLASVRANAERALELALEFDDPNLEVRALAESGYALVAAGELQDGFARLDEAMAAVAAGEVSDPAVAGKGFCAMLSACERSEDVSRAQEWIAIGQAIVKRGSGSPKILHTHCRAAYGSMLCAVGRWEEAEAAMLEALSMSSKSLMHRIETAARLAELRVQQGRLEEASALLGPFEDCPSAYVPIARLHMARGELDAAGAVIDRGLREMTGDALRQGILLSLLVDIELQRGRHDQAGAAEARLAELAEVGESRPLKVAALFVSARLAAAREHHDKAIELFRDAQRLLSQLDRPMLSGRLRLALAMQLHQRGDRAGAISEARAALATFDRLGARPYADEAAAFLRELGEATRARHGAAASAVAGLSGREQEVLGLLSRGLTNAEIAERLFISPKTAEHHVSRVLAKLGVRGRAEAAAMAVAASLST